jgi:hypothetical protein
VAQATSKAASKAAAAKMAPRRRRA